jgi:enoyl-CoA hydratase
MDMILSDRRLSAEEALHFGLVSRVAPLESYLSLALHVASAVADKAPVAVRAARQAVNAAFETSLSAGVHYERSLFHSLFATDDQKEGMAAFVEKRPPRWTGK